MKQSLKETHSFAPSFNLRRASLRRANLRRASGDLPSYLEFCPYLKTSFARYLDNRAVLLQYFFLSWLRKRQHLFPKNGLVYWFLKGNIHGISLYFSLFADKVSFPNTITVPLLCNTHTELGTFSKLLLSLTRLKDF